MADKEILQANEKANEEAAGGAAPEEIGDVQIADEVLSIVASLAAQEVEGVAGMNGGGGGGVWGGFAGDLSEFLGNKNVSKGVRVTVEGHVVSVEVYVNIEYGGCIPEIALEIQEKVREAIEDMTGYEVKIVDVHVQGVQRRHKTELEQSLEASDNN